MTTYDVHQHLWPESFVAALRERTAPPFLDGGELTTLKAASRSTSETTSS